MSRRPLEQLGARVGAHRVHIGVTSASDTDRRVARLDVDLHKFGASFRESMRLTAELVTLALEHGVPVEHLVEVLCGGHAVGGPAGAVEDVDGITEATSVPDLLGQVLAARMR